ncbi:hypothetical protein [Zoogloea sp.]|uniref:hypothetical protein n=1 Tax=Zoogloea sp. TaxID=49181 RepID=UPI0014161CDF|nr:MAG: hypothetical protein F9K15_16025 [Zoogloea sp.]
MTDTTFRLCHAGMDEHALSGFQACLSGLGADAWGLTEEASADAAFIDMDSDLGPYLLAAHRLLYPLRPLIVTRRPAGYRPDPLTIELNKPLRPSTLSMALGQARDMLPRQAASGLADAAEGLDDALDSIPDEMPFDALRSHPTFVPATEPADLLRRFEERLATLYVGSMPDVDLNDPEARSQIQYQPELFLQGLVARAVSHAREIAQPVRIDDTEGPALYLDPRNNRAYSARSANALRALAQLPTRGTVRMAALDPRTPSVPAGLSARPLEDFEWELALWASRGRLPAGTDVDIPVRLRSWPNLNRLTLPPEAVRIAGLWSRGPLSLRETVRQLDIPQRYVFAFYSACVALGHVDAPARRAPRSEAGTPSVQSGQVVSGGMIRRIVGRLLGPRPDGLPPQARA